jgi:hypothetical protein
MELWQTLDVCFDRPEKLIPEAMKLIINFCRYKVIECLAIKKLSSLLRSTKIKC